MRHIKPSRGVRVPNSQRRLSRATQVLLLKLGIICFAASITIYYSQNFLVAAVASTLAGCAVEIIDAHCEQHNDKRLNKIEAELNKLRQG